MAVKENLRQLADKGCIELEQTRKGHSVKVLLPFELSISVPEHAEEDIDIENLDFLQGREYVQEMLNRERDMFFYCLSELSLESCELDHVVSQLRGGDNSYKNVVATCHKCNTKKQATDAEDFLRSLYRKGMLSESEFEGRLSALDALRNGELKPEL